MSKSQIPCPTRLLDVGTPGQRSGQGAAGVLGHLENDSKQRATSPEERPVAVERINQIILVVDDAHALRYATARVLRASGFKTLEAYGGAHALQLAPSASAVVLDVHLPDIHGFEVCRLLRANPATASLPIVHLSGVYVSDEDKRAGGAAGADAYLVAPVSTEMLVSTIDKLLGTASDQAD